MILFQSIILDPLSDIVLFGGLDGKKKIVLTHSVAIITAIEIEDSYFGSLQRFGFILSLAVGNPKAERLPLRIHCSQDSMFSALGFQDTNVLINSHCHNNMVEGSLKSQTYQKARKESFACLYSHAVSNYGAGNVAFLGEALLELGLAFRPQHGHG